MDTASGDAMTTIAWDGDIIAADSQMSHGCYRCPGETEKVKCVNGWVYAITGYSAWFDAWISWHQGGCDPHTPPPCGLPSDSTGSFIASRNGECWSCTRELPYMQKVFAPDAWGSGYQYAIGAMLAGANAASAVEIAIKADVDSGGQVHVFANICVAPSCDEDR